MRTRFLLPVFLLALYASAQNKKQANWQQKVDYVIDVSLNDVDHRISGHIAMQYHNNSPSDLKDIYIHLWPNAYREHNTAFAKQMLRNGEMDFYRSEVQDRGEITDLKFTVNDMPVTVQKTDHIDVVKLILNEPLPSGEAISINSPFEVKIPRVFSRLGHKAQDYFMTQWYPKPAVYDVNGWNPMPYLNQGEFYSEFGSFKVSITLPDNYLVAATGTCTDNDAYSSDFKPGTGDSIPQSSNVMKTWTFEANQVHDFAWFASKRFGYVSKEVKVGDHTVIARVVASDPQSKFLNDIETAITYYSDNVGPYPYPHATVVHGELKAGGGMEYPMITVCDALSSEVIIHEVGHNWFYGILGSNEREYPWMDESINSYYDKTGKHGGEQGLNTDFFLGVLLNDQYLTNSNQAIGLPADEFNWTNYGTVVYGAGAMSFAYLRAYLGKDEFKTCMEEYFQTWKFKHPLPGDMKASFERTSGKDLTWFFDELLSSDAPLDFKVKRAGDSIAVENRGGYTAPVPVTVKANGSSTTQWYMIGAGRSVNVASTAADDVIADADDITLDVFSNNDQLKKKLKLGLGTGRDKKSIRELYVLPVFGWNAYDRFMMGAYFHNHSVSNKRVHYSVTPMYSFNQKALRGMASLDLRTPMKGYGSYMDAGVRIRSFSFEEIGISPDPYTYMKVAPYIDYHLPLSNARDRRHRLVRVQLDQIMLSPQFEVDTDTMLGPALPVSNTRSFASIQYKVNNERAVNPYRFNMMLEYGKIGQKIHLGDLNDRRIRRIVTDTLSNEKDTFYYYPYNGSKLQSDDFLKVSASLDYDMEIGMEKPVHFRIFGSYLFQSIPNTTYKNSVGSTDGAGYYDYRMDDVLMHRNATYGMFRNQINPNRDFTKFVGPVASADRWLVSGSITLPLPGKLPVYPYVEFLSFYGLKDGTTTTVTGNSSGFLYNVGLEVELIKDRLEVFVNLAQSNEVTNMQENPYIGIDNLLERITFNLNLNDINLPKIKQNTKLF